MGIAGYIGRRAAVSGLAAALFAAAGNARAGDPNSSPGVPSDMRRRVPAEFDLSSGDGRPYRILVSAPEGDPPPGGFPVFYVVDGHGWFGTAVEIARMRERSKLDPLVIVGIGYPSRRFFDPERNLDLTPPGVMDARFEGVALGGADRFLAFINGVLKPRIAAEHAINPAREALFGHSLGGLFALHSLFRSPASFDVFIAASPSVGFGDRAIVNEAAAFRAPAASPPRLLVTMGGLEVGVPTDLAADYRRWYEAHPEAHEGQTVDQVIAETFSAADAAYDRVSEARAMTERLKAAGLRATWAEFPGEEHTAAGVSALNRAIPFVLRPAG